MKSSLNFASPRPSPKERVSGLFTAVQTLTGSANYLLQFFLLALLITQHPALNAQTGGVSIGDSLRAPDASAVLELFSSDKGFLPPRMTTAQRDSIASPADGLIVYDMDLNKLFYFHDQWKAFSLWNIKDSINIYYAGQVIIGDTSNASWGTLVLNGTSGIYSNVAADTIKPIHSFNTEFTGEGNRYNVAISTHNISDSPDSTTSGLISYVESNSWIVASSSLAYYTGDGSGLVVGAYLGSHVEDTSAQVVAVGAMSQSTTPHAGVNIGINANASEAVFNISGVFATNVPEDVPGPLHTILDSFPDYYSAGLLSFNYNSDTNDFNLFAPGEAKSYFEGKVGIGTQTPAAKLDVAGAVNSTAYLLNGDTLAIDGAWSNSGSDIYYDEGSVSIGSTITGDLSATMNAVGEVTMLNDTFLDQYPKTIFIMRTNEAHIPGFADIDNPVIGFGMFDTTSYYGALDTVNVHFAIERFEGEDIYSSWKYEINDTAKTALYLGRKGIGINASSLTAELQVNGNIRQSITTSNVSNPPTDTELDGLFTSPVSKGPGWTAYVKDSNSDNLYQIMAVGNDWYIVSTAKAQ